MIKLPFFLSQIRKDKLRETLNWTFLFPGSPTPPLTQIALRSDQSAHCSPRSNLVCWQENTNSFDREAPTAAFRWEHQILLWIATKTFGVKKTHHGAFLSHDILWQEWRVQLRLWPTVRINKMFCEQEKSVTLTKNNIGQAKDSYRRGGGQRRGKFMQMKQEIQFVCVNKSSVALCERNQLLT